MLDDLWHNLQRDPWNTIKERYINHDNNQALKVRLIRNKMPTDNNNPLEHFDKLQNPASTFQFDLGKNIVPFRLRTPNSITALNYSQNQKLKLIRYVNPSIIVSHK